MNIDIINKQSVIPIPLARVRRIVAAVVDFEKVHCDEVAIHFVETEEICALHAEFFDDPSPTDCISFPMEDDVKDVEGGFCALGDVFVCPQTALQYAAAHKTDPLFEVTLYIVHGLLHLMGYDDIEEVDRRKMRAAERRHMANLQQVNLCL